MALVVGTNSWITLAEAETYFSERIQADPWDNLPDDATKEKYLISAYHWIKDYPGVTAPASSASEAVKRAQAEGALFLISFYDEINNRDALYSAGVRDFKKSKWEEELAEQTLPKTVTNPLCSGGFYNGGAAAMFTLTDSNTCY